MIDEVRTSQRNGIANRRHVSHIFELRRKENGDTAQRTVELYYLSKKKQFQCIKGWGVH